MLSDDEWVQLLEYLLASLRRVEAHTDVLDSIRSAISIQVVEQKTPRQSEPDIPYFQGVLSVQAVSNRSEPDQSAQLFTITRPLSPKEAFLKAIEVIEIRATMLPEIARRTTELLQSSEIIWRTEAYTDGQDNNRRLDFLSDSLEFSNEELLIQQASQKAIEYNLSRLKSLLQDATSELT
jgi:hypothetical protein